MGSILGSQRRSGAKYSELAKSFVAAIKFMVDEPPRARAQMASDSPPGPPPPPPPPPPTPQRAQRAHISSVSIALIVWSKCCPQLLYSGRRGGPPISYFLPIVESAALHQVVHPRNRCFGSPLSCTVGGIELWLPLPRPPVFGHVLHRAGNSSVERCVSRAMIPGSCFRRELQFLPFIFRRYRTSGWFGKP